MSQKTWVIIPVKRLSQAKRRLAPVLPPEARRQLMLVMLQDVLGTLAQVADIASVLVVTSDARVAEVARNADAAVMPEPGSTGLNAALQAGLAYAQERGATDALILPADVPLATADELRRLLTKPTGTGASEPRAVLVPSHDGAGTNALALSPPGALEPTFGPGSFLRHLAQAVAHKLDVQVLQPPGLALDIDEPRDLVRLSELKQGSERYAFLETHLVKPEHARTPRRGPET